jgi:hypothetical protein
MNGIIRNFSTYEIDRLQNSFLNGLPFRHVIIDNFFLPHVAEEIAAVFPKYDSSIWTAHYNNDIEVKKACSHWDKFPRQIYNALFSMCSTEFSDFLFRIVNKHIYADYGLHGGGLHAHTTAGKLNVHRDYSVHPKLNLQRNYNIIVYMTPDWNPEWGGGLELWTHNYQTDKPEKKYTTVENKFNRAVLFDTTQHSWHGLPETLNCPEGLQRQSLAVYYLSNVDATTKPNRRAVFVPHTTQLGNDEIEELCKRRSI